MTLGILVISVSVAIFLYLCIGGPLDLTALQEAREKAGASVIALRDECQVEGWTDDGTFNDKWEKANAAYNVVLQAEEMAVNAAARTENMRLAGERIGRDAERLASARRSTVRPDYDPSGSLRARGASPVFPTASEWNAALVHWMNARRTDYFPEDSDIAASRRCRRNPNAEEFALPSGESVMAMIAQAQGIFDGYPIEQQAQAVREVWASWNTMTPESAGYVAEPPQVIRTLEINKLLFGGILQVATIKTTSTGEDILLPFTDDTTVKGRIITEDGPVGAENNPKFGQIRWGNYKFTSDSIIVTYEMLRDAFMDLESHIGEIGGQRLGRVENDYCTTGTGNSQPRGIVFAAPIGKQTAANNAITTDEIIDLEASVDDAYIQGGTRVGFMMHKGIITYLRKLKDLNGRPFYLLGQETGSRDQLNGKNVYINYSMESTLGALKDVMLYGDLAKYQIRRVGGTRLVRDPYTQLIPRDAQVFAALEYLDGNLINAGNSPVKKLRMAA